MLSPLPFLPSCFTMWPCLLFLEIFDGLTSSFMTTISLPKNKILLKTNPGYKSSYEGCEDMVPAITRLNGDSELCCGNQASIR